MNKLHSCRRRRRRARAARLRLPTGNRVERTASSPASRSSARADQPVVTAVTCPRRNLDLRRGDGGSRALNRCLWASCPYHWHRLIGLATALAISAPIAAPAQTTLDGRKHGSAYLRVCHIAHCGCQPHGVRCCSF